MRSRKRVERGWLPKGIGILEAMRLAAFARQHRPCPTRKMCLQVYGPKCKPEKVTDIHQQIRGETE